MEQRFRKLLGTNFGSIEVVKSQEGATSWHSITNLALESSSNTWVDVDAPGSNGRFYRARPPKLQDDNPPVITHNEVPVLKMGDVLRD